jgi:ribosomal protein S18 acetylase RimI-like enzyme
MPLEFREVRLAEAWSRVHGDRPMPAQLLSLKAWECVDDSRVVGHCEADTATGEVLGLSVLADYQNRGIGRRLLSLIVGCLRVARASRVWVAAPADSSHRAYGFYRAVGWVPTGERNSDGSEILELRSG